MTELAMPTWLFEWSAKGLLGFLVLTGYGWVKAGMKRQEQLRGDVERLQKAAIVQHRALLVVAQRDRRTIDLFRRFLYAARCLSWSDRDRNALERIQYEVDDLRERSYHAQQARSQRLSGQRVEETVDLDFPDILPPPILDQEGA